MADIKFLAGLDIDGNINLNKNQLQSAVIHPLGSNPSSPSIGQLYFNTSDSELKIYTSAGWIAVGADTDNYVDDGTYSGGTLTLERTGSLGDIDISGFLEIGSGAGQALAGNTTTITTTQAAAIITNSGKTSFPGFGTTAGTALEGNTIIPADDLSDVLSRGNITDGNDIAVSAGDDITMTDSSKLIMDSDFQIYKNVGNNAVISETGSGDLLLLSNNEVEIKSGELGETYAKFTKDAGIELYTNDSKKFETTSTGITITGKGLSTATAVNDASTTLTTKGYVDGEISSAITGQLVYQGGYDASAAPPTGTSVKKGFTYTVTTAGDGNGFFSVPLEIGDLIIAEQDNPTTEANWTEVNKNIDLATTSTVGVVQPSSDNFAISSAGLLTIKNNGVILGTETTGSYVNSLVQGTNVTITNNTGESTTPTISVSNSSIDNRITNRQYSGLIGNGSLTVVPVTASTHGLGTDSSQFMVQLIQVSNGETVHAEVARSTGGVVEVGFTTAPATNAIRILINKIG